MLKATKLKRRSAKVAFVDAILALARKYPKIATGSGAFTSDLSKTELTLALIAVRKAVDAEKDGKRALQTGKGCSTPPPGYKNDNGITAGNLYQFLVAGIDKSQSVSCFGHYFQQAFNWALAVIAGNPHAFPNINAATIKAEIEKAAEDIAVDTYGQFCEQCYGTTKAHMEGCIFA